MQTCRTIAAAPALPPGARIGSGWIGAGAAASFASTIPRAFAESARADSDVGAIARADQTDRGITATLCTRNRPKARGLRAGTVGVNAWSEGEVWRPFGGVKPSGFGGRDKGNHAHDQQTELKTIRIDVDG